MIRIVIPGGGPITTKQWAILDDLSSKYTISDSYTGKPNPSLRLTTRQNVQFHWIKKKDLVEAVCEIAKSGFYSINGCGDNVRNVMGCPLSNYSHIYNANEWAQKVGKYFQLPTSAYIEIFEIDRDYLRKEGDYDIQISENRFQYAPNLLNRKFKIAFSAIHFDHERRALVPDNCVELRTNDIGVAPILNSNNNNNTYSRNITKTTRGYNCNDDVIANCDSVNKFQVYIGGSQGERMGFPTFSALGSPLGKVAKEDLLRVLDAIVSIQQEWGDRQNRHWARMKYILQKMGMEWFRKQVLDTSDGISLEEPDHNLDYGSRNLHHGWISLQQKEEKSPPKIRSEDMRLCYGAFIENGRIIDDSPNGKLKKMVRYLMDNYNVEMFITPNQDLLFGNISGREKKYFENDMIKMFGYGSRTICTNESIQSNSNKNKRGYSNLRVLSGFCVGRDTCRLAYTDSEKFEPYLIDELESRWGHMSESIGITGCERQCFRPATKTIGWIGTGLNMYMLKLGGTEDGKNQGWPLVDPDSNEIFLRNVPRKDIATVTDALFEYYYSSNISSSYECRPGEMGYFFRRIGPKMIIQWLKSNPKTAHLMKPIQYSSSRSQSKAINPSNSLSIPSLRGRTSVSINI
jgi:sulfite reductase beta subunit-like hemoprotein